jgi:hypothetical protein
MNRGKLQLVVVIALLASAVLACALPGSVQTTQYKVGATQNQALTVSLPADKNKPIDVNLRFGAAEMTAGTGTTKLVEGNVQYNVPEFLPTVTQSGNKADILQGPSGGFQGAMPKDLINKWSLRFGNGAPMNLTVQAGDYAGSWELGGVRFQGLTWVEGVSKSTIAFSYANPDKLETFSFTTGASTVKLTGLGNLNFAKMSFQSGAGTYTLDFGGKLRRSATADVKTMVSNVTIVIPASTGARVTLKSAVSNTKTVGSWNNVGSTYMTGKYDTASEKLEVNLDMGLGQLTLDTH